MGILLITDIGINNDVMFELQEGRRMWRCSERDVEGEIMFVEARKSVYERG